MTDQRKPADVKSADLAFAQLIRDKHHARRVNWIQSTDPDPAVRAQDRQDLNEALRKAAGRTPPDAEEDDDAG